jgi:hypothetical protein
MDGIDRSYARVTREAGASVTRHPLRLSTPACTPAKTHDGTRRFPQTDSRLRTDPSCLPARAAARTYAEVLDASTGASGRRDHRQVASRACFTVSSPQRRPFAGSASSWGLSLLRGSHSPSLVLPPRAPPWAALRRRRNFGPTEWSAGLTRPNVLVTHGELPMAQRDSERSLATCARCLEPPHNQRSTNSGLRPPATRSSRWGSTRTRPPACCASVTRSVMPRRRRSRSTS